MYENRMTMNTIIVNDNRTIIVQNDRIVVYDCRKVIVRLSYTTSTIIVQDKDNFIPIYSLFLISLYYTPFQMGATLSYDDSTISTRLSYNGGFPISTLVHLLFSQYFQV